MIARSSFTTSTTQSHSARRARSSSKLPTSISESAAVENSGAGFCLRRFASAESANLLRNAFLPVSSPGPAFGGTMSRSSDGMPALARCAAMPLPITPEPNTATLRIEMPIERSPCAKARTVVRIDSDVNDD